MSKTAEIRTYLLGFEVRPVRISSEHLAWIAEKFGVTTDYARHVVNGAAISVGDYEDGRGRRFGSSR